MRTYQNFIGGEWSGVVSGKTFQNANPADTRRSPNLVDSVHAHAGPAATVAASAWWLVEVTRSWAGRDAPSVTVGAILVAIAVILVRPDRVLPRSAVVLATGISVGAFVVPLADATGWALTLNHNAW